MAECPLLERTGYTGMAGKHRDGGNDVIYPKRSSGGLRSRSAAVSSEVCYHFGRKHGGIGQ